LLDPKLPDGFRVTEAIGNAGEHSMTADNLAFRQVGDPTEDDVIGPYYRKRAPYRAKISPPMAAGETLVISGGFGVSVRKHRLVTACSMSGKRMRTGTMTMKTRRTPPQPDSFVNRARLHCEEYGHYELETVYPGPYRMDATTWRSPHLHFLVRAFGFKTLVTQLFFAGAPYLDSIHSLNHC
jgi:hypothetical protein